MQNARFWEYTNHGLVKITLRPGQTLHHWQGRETDEGWSSEANRWTLEDDTVQRETVHDGRDCDGRLTQHYLAACSVYALDICAAYENPGLFVPDWRAVDSSQTDEYAEVSGY